MLHSHLSCMYALSQLRQHQNLSKTICMIAEPTGSTSLIPKHLARNHYSQNAITETYVKHGVPRHVTSCIVHFFILLRSKNCLSVLFSDFFVTSFPNHINTTTFFIISSPVLCGHSLLYCSLNNAIIPYYHIFIRKC